MSIVASIRSQLVPVSQEGYPFIATFGIGSLILMWLWSPLGWLGFMATLWCVYFFRDPARVTPLREGLVISPADGRVSRVVNAVPPAELALGDRPVARISIFMSVFDCHVNRSPVTGRIERMAYRAGLFINADQVAGKNVLFDSLYKYYWRETVSHSGLDHEALVQAFERTKLDKLAPLATQLKMLEKAGFNEVDCIYKNMNFAVFGGFKDENVETAVV